MVPRQPQNTPTETTYQALVISFALFAIIGGTYAGMQPISMWRFFSWHPLLMTFGMIALPGMGALTKKRLGYSNTKVRVCFDAEITSYLYSSTVLSNTTIRTFSYTPFSVGYRLLSPLPDSCVFTATRKSITASISSHIMGISDLVCSFGTLLE